jgi:hypothetical protein
MLLFAALVGQIQITTANQGGFPHTVRMGFVVFAVLCIAGVFASLAYGSQNHLRSIRPS